MTDKPPDFANTPGGQQPGYTPPATKYGAVAPNPADSIAWGFTHANKGAATWLSAGAKIQRGSELGIEPEYNAPPAEVVAGVKRAIGEGFTPIVMIQTPQATVLSAVSTAAFGEGVAAIIAAVEAAYPQQVVYELINEPFFKGPHGKSNAADYGKLIKSAYEHVAALKLGAMPQMLVAAFGTYEMVNGAGEGTAVFSDVYKGEGWIADVCKELGGQLTAINGWAIHPYGLASGPGDNEDNFALSVAADYRGRIFQEGAGGSENIWITEFGYAVIAGESKGAEVKTEAERLAAFKAALPRIWRWMQEGWLTACVFYAAEAAAKWNLINTTSGAYVASFIAAHQNPNPNTPDLTVRRKQIGCYIPGIVAAPQEAALGWLEPPQDRTMYVYRAILETEAGEATAKLAYGASVLWEGKVTSGGQVITFATPFKITSRHILRLEITGVAAAHELTATAMIEERPPGA